MQSHKRLMHANQLRNEAFLWRRTMSATGGDANYSGDVFAYYFAHLFLARTVLLDTRSRVLSLTEGTKP